MPSLRNSCHDSKLNSKVSPRPDDTTSLWEFCWQHPEYNDTQCDKRNSYRHRVKAEKAEKTGGEGNDAADATDASLLAAQLNGVANGHAEAGDQDGERPSKKFKGTDGHVVITPGEPIDEDDVGDMGADADDDEEEGDEEGDDDEPEDDDGDDDDDDDEVADETMEGMDEPEMDGRGEMKDEALDGNESD
jgi:DNA polymerase epsilon subunit 3